MKTILITFLLATVFAGLAKAAPVSARYLRFEGYYSSNTFPTTQIAIYEIEAWSNGLNAAKTSTVTANSNTGGSTSLNYLKDGNTAGSLFFSSRTSPGPASEAAPHWVQMDLGSAMPIDRIKTYLHPTYLIGCGIFLSSDGTNWTQFGRYDQVSGLIETDPSAPWVTIKSAAMRPGTTLMDVVYRINDVDDATVKVRALAFVDGVRSFAKVLRPVTFVEGTAVKIGDAIPTNTDHTLTWDVGADWNIDLGQVKFEILARDARGLLAFDWISIPAVGANPALTISKDAPSDASVLNALFWQYADGDPWLNLANGLLTGNAGSGVFADAVLANGNVLQSYSTAYVLKRMNFDPANSAEMSYSITTARAALLSTSNWHAANRPYAGITRIVYWGNNDPIPAGLTGVTAIACGYQFSLALKSNGTVVGWGTDSHGQITAPAGLIGVTAIAAGYYPDLYTQILGRRGLSWKPPTARNN